MYSLATAKSQIRENTEYNWLKILCTYVLMSKNQKTQARADTPVCSYKTRYTKHATKRSTPPCRTLLHNTSRHRSSTPSATLLLVPLRQWDNIKQCSFVLFSQQREIAGYAIDLAYVKSYVLMYLCPIIKKRFFLPLVVRMTKLPVSQTMLIRIILLAKRNRGVCHWVC